MTERRTHRIGGKSYDGVTARTGDGAPPCGSGRNALAGGNTVLLKPAREGPSAGNFLAELLADAGLRNHMVVWLPDTGRTLQPP